MTRQLLMITALAIFPALAGAESPCKKDREAFCAKVPRGEGRVLKCLREKRDKLAAECRAHLDARKEEIKEARVACEDDVEEHCANVEKGEGRLLRCLAEHLPKGDLSESCAKHLDESRKGKKNGKG